MADRQATAKVLETKGIPRILALDGGGVRGLSSLLILEKLMHEIQRLKGDSQTPLPCEYFDLICGTSTGGLIAIMLGRLRMPVDECIKKYMELAKTAFRLDNVKMGVPVGDNHCRFDEKPLEKALKDVIREITDDEDAPMADPHDQNPEKSCPVFVIATEGQDASGPEKLFRTYGFYKDRCPIWQAARATSAAPSYFLPAWVEVPSPGGWYIDGGLKRNNPSEVGLTEAKRYWKTAKRVLIVSIGTGVQKTADFIENPEPPEKSSDEQANAEKEGQSDDSMQYTEHSSRGVKRRFESMVSGFVVSIKAAASNLPSTDSVAQYSRIPGGLMTLRRFAAELVKLSTNSEDTQRNMWERAHSHDESQHFLYYRFNVPFGMEEIGLEEWKNMIKIGALTRGYLRTPLVETEMERCAKSLVNPPSFESLPHPCFMVPYERNQHFAGRDAFLKQLFNKFWDPSPARYQGRLALYGLGGIGKTQVALEFIYRYQSSYNRIYWISAVSQESLLDGYEKIAKRAEINIPPDSEPIEIADCVLSWLRKTQNWLLVIDNLDDIEVLSTGNLNIQNIIETLLPQPGPQQHTLITTRNAHADNIPAQGVEVSLFDKSESIELLVSLSNISVSSEPTELECAEKIVHELGYLPLAIVQAAAYIKEVTKGFGSFLEQYHSHRSDLHRWIPQGLRPYSVATTWSMSFEVVRARNPQGAELFQLLSFLNPDGVRIDFLQSGIEALQNDVRQVLSNQIDMAKALIELEKFSLLKWDRRAQTLLIHRLVQAVVKDEMSDTDLATFRNIVVDLCYRAFPEQWDDVDKFVVCRAYASQVMTPLLDIRAAQTDKAAHAMSRVGGFLREDGKFRDSEQLSVRSLKILRDIHGNDHLCTLRSMDNLASTYWNQGKLEAAATLQEEVLQKSKQILGIDHPDTLTSMSNLASTYWHQGKMGEAATLQEEVLQKSKRILGIDHPDTLTSMDNLASTYCDQDKMEEAATLQEEVLQKSKQILGIDHPDTLTSMSNLASTYWHQGKMGEAATLQEEVLQKRKQILGIDHPDTLTSMNNLASTYSDQGKMGEAATLQEEVLQKRKQILGHDHPDTLCSMSNLASIYLGQRRTEEAAMLQEVVDKITRQEQGHS